MSDINSPRDIPGAKRLSICESEYNDAQESYTGYCVKCHASQDGCEPDAELYKCESCGEPAVYGVEQLLVHDFIDITGDDE